MEELFCSVQLTIISSQSGHRTFPSGVVCKRLWISLGFFADQNEKVNVKNLKYNTQVFRHRSFHSRQKILVLYYFLVLLTFSILGIYFPKYMVSFTDNTLFFPLFFFWSSSIIIAKFVYIFMGFGHPRFLNEKLLFFALQQNYRKKVL